MRVCVWSCIWETCSPWNSPSSLAHVPNSSLHGAGRRGMREWWKFRMRWRGIKPPQSNKLQCWRCRTQPYLRKFDHSNASWIVLDCLLPLNSTTLGLVIRNVPDSSSSTLFYSPLESSNTQLIQSLQGIFIVFKSTHEFVEGGRSLLLLIFSIPAFYVLGVFLVLWWIGFQSYRWTCRVYHSWFGDLQSARFINNSFLFTIRKPKHTFNYLLQGISIILKFR